MDKILLFVKDFELGTKISSVLLHSYALPQQIF